jgi:hypothetical protein
MFEQMPMSKMSNIVGLSMCLAGAFLLSVEALRIVKYGITIEKLKEFGEKRIIDPLGKEHKPLPFTWRFALICLGVCLFVWIWVTPLILWTLTPALFVAVFFIYKILRWSVSHSDDGLAAFAGFVFLTLGTVFQLVATLIS